MSLPQEVLGIDQGDYDTKNAPRINVDEEQLKKLIDQPKSNEKSNPIRINNLRETCNQLLGFLLEKMKENNLFTEEEINAVNKGIEEIKIDSASP